MALNITHRGVLSEPENSLAAFRKAWELGFDGLECDLRVSLDGIPFLLHDDTLERTSEGEGAAETMSWGALSELRLRDRQGEFTEETLPTLAWLLQECPPGKKLNLEIKTDASRAPAIALLLKEALSSGAVEREQLLISSFQADVVRGMAKSLPEVERGLLLDDLPGVPLKDLLEDAGAQLLIPGTRLLSHRSFSQEKRLWTWTAKGMQEAKELAARYPQLEAVIVDA